MLDSGTQDDTHAIFILCYALVSFFHGYIKEEELMDLTDMLGNCFQPELTNIDVY